MDRSGLRKATAAGVFSTNTYTGVIDKLYGTYPGKVSSVANAQPLAMALALETGDAQMLALGSDSIAAIWTLLNLGQGHPPGPAGIEGRFENPLLNHPDRHRIHMSTGTCWHKRQQSCRQ